MYKRTGYAGGPLSGAGNFLIKINSTDIYTLNLPTLTKITCKKMRKIPCEIFFTICVNMLVKILVISFIFYLP